MQAKLRTFLDTLHGSKWAQIIPLSLMAVLYVISMIVWRPANAADWVTPLFIDAMGVGSIYYIGRLCSDWKRLQDGGVLFITFSAALCTLLILSQLPVWFADNFNPGLGAGPALFLSVSLYHRYRMKEGI